MLTLHEARPSKPDEMAEKDDGPDRAKDGENAEYYPPLEGEGHLAHEAVEDAATTTRKRTRWNRETRLGATTAGTDAIGHVSIERLLALVRGRGGIVLDLIYPHTTINTLYPDGYTSGATGSGDVIEERLGEFAGHGRADLVFLAGPDADPNLKAR